MTPTLWITCASLLTCSLALRFQHSAVLDTEGKFVLHWTSDDNNLVIQAEVATTGYFGLGFSAHARMEGADILAAWVSDGRGHLTDLHGIGHTQPVRDQTQSWHLVRATENATHTVVRATRALHTCDKHDYDFEGNTVRVLWSYYPHDPYSDGRLPYHGRERRGVRSLHVTGAAAKPRRPQAGDYVMELFNPKIKIPKVDTMYWCQAFKLPPLKRKHHITRFEPVIQPGHEGLVHHILLYMCHHWVNDSYHGYGHNCYSPNMPESFLRCTSVIAAWAIGGGAFYYPRNAGFSLGDKGDPTFVWMETHYDNPQFRSGLRDSSGLRFFYTTRIRQYDAGILQVGHMVSTKQLIPPHQERFTTYGFCVPQCLQEALADSQHGINVFAGIQHSHTIGRALRTRHFRRGRELQPLLVDDTYDFNYQEGDSLLIECDYNSKDRVKVTRGGISTKHEMCLTFLAYYPKVKLANCESRPTFPSVLAITNIEQLDWSRRPPRVSSPRSLRGLSWLEVMESKVNWSDPSVVERYQDIVANADILARCNMAETTSYDINWKIIQPPSIPGAMPRSRRQCGVTEWTKGMSSRKDTSLKPRTGQRARDAGARTVRTHPHSGALGGNPQLLTSCGFVLCFLLLRCLSVHGGCVLWTL